MLDGLRAGDIAALQDIGEQEFVLREGADVGAQGFEGVEDFGGAGFVFSPFVGPLYGAPCRSYI